MWSISDKFAPPVAKDVCEELFWNGTTPDYRDATMLLNDLGSSISFSAAPKLGVF